MFRRIVDWLFGYDFFISYSWGDGRSYAEGLYQQLTDKGFTCFLDSKKYAKGDDWKAVGAWTLRHTGCLVLVGTPAALESKSVERELQLFDQTKRRIIPININHALLNVSESNLAEYLPNALLGIEEPHSGGSAPSQVVITEIANSFDLVRQSTKRLRVTIILTILFFCLALALAVLSYLTNQTNVQLKKQQVVNHGSVLFLQAERLSNNKRPNYPLSNLLAIESYQRADNLEALNLLRSNLRYQGQYSKGYTIPWHLGGDEIQYAANFQVFVHYHYSGKIVVYRTADGERLNDITGLYRINYVAISPHGKYLAVAHRTEDGLQQLSVYRLGLPEDASQPEWLYSKPFKPPIDGGHTRYRPMAFSEDGERLALAPTRSINQGKDNWIELYDSATGEAVYKFKTNVRTTLLSLHGNTMFFSGRSLKDNKKVLRAYDIDSKKITSVHSFSSDIYDFALSNDAKQLVIAVGRTLYAKRWDIQSKKLQKIKNLKYQSKIMSVNYSYDSQRLLVTNSPDFIDVRESQNFSHHFKVKTSWRVGNTGFIDPQKLVTVRKHEGPLTFEFWKQAKDLRTKFNFRKPPYETIYTGLLNNQALVADNQRLLRVINESEQREAQVYDLASEPEISHRFKLEGHTAAISRSGRYLALDQGNGEVSIWDLDKDAQVKQVKYSDNENEHLTFLAFDQHSRLVTATHEVTPKSMKDLFRPTVDDSIKIWALSLDQEPITFNAGIAVGYAISPSGKQLLTTTNFYHEMWDLDSGCQLFSVDAAKSNVFSGDQFWSPKFLDGNHLFSVVTERQGGGRRLELRSSQNGDVQANFSLSAGLVVQLTIPELQLLVLGLDSGQILFIDLVTLRQVYSLNHGKSIKHLAYSSSHDYLLTLADDEHDQIKQWSLTKEDAKEINRISQVGGNTVWIGSEGDKAYIIGELFLLSLPLKSKLLLEAAQNRLKQNISLKDWLNYFPGMPYNKTLPNRPLGEINGNITLEQFDLLLQNLSASREPEFFQRLLFWAVKNRRTDIVPLIADKGTDLNASSLKLHPQAESAISESIRLGFDDLVIVLLEHGADWRKRGQINSSPLWLALTLNKDHSDSNMPKIIRALIDKGAHKPLLTQSSFINSDEYAMLQRILTKEKLE